jgi:hypothetical protein
MGEMPLSDHEHLLHEPRCAMTGMHLKECVPPAFRVQYRCDPSTVRLPEEHVLLHAMVSHVLRPMPPPTVKPIDLPAQFPPVIE